MTSAWNAPRRRVGRRWAWAIGVAVLGGLALAVWAMVARPSAARPDPDPAPAVGLITPAAPDAPSPPPAVAVREAAPRGVVITGIVVTPDGKPADGATVSIHRLLTAWPEWRSERVEQAIAITGPDGRFQIRAAQRHGLLVGFEHTAWAGGLEQVPLQPTPLRLQLQQAFELFGEVQNAAGAGVPNARVALESVLSEQRRAQAVTTGANGAYRFTNLPAGPVRIVARHEAWQPVAVSVHVVGDVQRRNLVFERQAMAPMRGRVVAANSLSPIEGASIELLAANGRPGLADPITARSAADGTFSLLGLPRGNLRVLVRHPDHGALMRNVTGGANLGELALELPARSAVRGRLVGDGDGDGGPEWAGEVIEIRDSAGQVDYATVEAGGGFRFATMLSPGSATVSAASGLFAFERTRAREITVRIEESAATELELAIVPPAVVRGRLVDGAGRPLAGATVSQTRVLAEAARSIGTAITQLDLGSFGSRVVQLFGGDRDELLAVSEADGTFDFRGQKPGPLSVRIELAGHGARWQSVTVPSGADALVLGDVVMPPGCRIQGRVLRNRRGLAGASVTAVGGESQAVALTRRDGTFVFEDLMPGEYGLRARLPSMPNGSAEQRVVASPGRVTFEPVFELDSGRVVRGAVAGTDGQPVPGALVTVRGAVGQTTMTDNSGDFLLELPAGAFDLQVSLHDRSQRKIISVAATEENVAIRLDTPPVTTVTATVLGLPGRKRMTAALLRVVRLDDSSDALPRAVWLELPNGELSWSACPVGRLRVEVWCEGYAPFVVEREFLTGIPQQLGEVLLEPGGRLVGRVRDADGAPVGNAMVWLGEETDADLFEPQVRTDNDGSFRLSGVTSRSSRVVVRTVGFAPRTIDLNLPQDVLSAAPLEVHLERGAVIELQSNRAAAAAGDRVELRRNGRLVATAEFDETGRAWFPNRAADTYTATVPGIDAPAKTVVVETGVPVVRVQMP